MSGGRALGRAGTSRLRALVAAAALAAARGQREHERNGEDEQRYDTCDAHTGPTPYPAERFPTYLGVLVLGPGAALGRSQAPALRGDRAALDAVRRGHLHADVPVALRLADLVHLRRAHPLPELAECARDARLDPDVARLVVARLVPRREDRRELVEDELPVGRRIPHGALGLEELVPGVGLGPNRTGGHSSLRQGHQRGERAADEEAAPEDLAH